MHPTAYNLMLYTLETRQNKEARVLDVGSRNINGTYRPIIQDKGWSYFGLDIEMAPNVDLVADPYSYPFPDNTFDFVISGSTMEHVQSIWRWIPELARVLKVDSTLIVLTVWQSNEHKAPHDCWRILPDGIRHLFDLTHNLTDYNISMPNAVDLYATAQKISLDPPTPENPDSGLESKPPFRL